ncbi:MAG: iron-sulfur cluster insertion protein ErpA [Myxococcota bacterium]
MSTETATQTSPETQPKATPEAITDPAMAGALSLTEGAAEKVREIRDAETIEPHYALRVKVMGGGCSGFQYDLYFDEYADGDYVFESCGVKLLSDQMSFMYLMGTSVDYVEGLQGAGFKFNNPNTTGSCGCGSSFSV